MKHVLIASLKASRRTLAQTVIALIVLSAAQVLFLLLVGPFMRGLFGPPDAVISLKSLLPQGAIRFLGPIGETVALSRSDLALYIPILLVLAAIIKGGAGYVYQLSQQLVALDLASHLRESLFRALLRRSYTSISLRSPASWMSLIMNDVMYLQTRFSDIVSSMLRDGVLVISCFVALMMIHPPTALVLALVSPFLIWGLGRTGKRIAVFAEAWQHETRQMTAAILEIRSRFLFIRAQHGEAREAQRFDAINQNYYGMIKRSILLRSLFAPGLEFLGFLVFGIAVYGIGHRFWLKDFGPDALIQFFAALGIMLRPLRTIGEQLGRLEETRGAMTEPTRLLAADSTAPESQLRKRADFELYLPKVLIRDIACGHNANIVFSGKSLELRRGKTIAVVGPSGSGKSTLLKTLAGLLHPIEWDASLSWVGLCAHAAFVSQFPFLFDDSLRANLCYGLDIPASDDMIAAALTRVNMTPAVAAAGGLDAHVKALGTALSGGQIQRLVIARAELSQRPLLLLDEATSALDPQNERWIMQSLISSCRDDGKTLIAVSHRTTFLDSFDEIWFVKDHVLRLQGTHAQLLADSGYRAFVGGHADAC